MRYLPIMLDLKGRKVVVVGGGKIAAHKSIGLVRAEAAITVIAPQLGRCMSRLVKNGWVRHLAREYTAGDLAGAFMAIAATDSPEVNRAVAREAATGGILVNCIDAREMSSFHSPAVVRRGDLVLVAATAGAAPSLARRIRRELAAAYGREYGLTLQLIGAVREKLLTRKGNCTYSKKILRELADSNLPALFKSGSVADIDHLLQELCGAGFSLAELGLRKEDSQ